MREDDQLALAAQMANVIARFEERCERVERRQDLLADQLSARVEEKVDRWLQSCAGQVETTVRGGFGPPVAEFGQTVRGVAAEAARTTRGLDAVRGDFASQRRWMLSGVGGALVACAASLVATYQLAYGFYQNRYDTLMTQVTYLDAVNHADVVPCGAGRLCARLDGEGPRTGDPARYRLIALRP